MTKILLKKIKFTKELLRKNKIISKNLKIYNSTVLVTPILLWKCIMLYNGKTSIVFNITKERIGVKLNKLLLKKNNFKNTL